MQVERTARFAIVDASVTSEMRKQHSGLIWVAEQERIRARGGDAHSVDEYFGYHPDSPEKVRRIQRDSFRDIDLVYMADLQGVWRSSLEKFELLRDRRTDELLHSGLSIREIDTIIEFIDSGKTIVGEAFLFYATYEGGVKSRNRLEEAFGVQWTGWIGGWFKDLNNILEVPFWVRAMYERATMENWSFQGEGVLLIKPAESKFVVLTPGVELRDPRPELVVTRRDRALGGGVRSGIPQWGWFEIVEAMNPEQIRALIRLTPTEIGERILEDNGLPPIFPAAVVQSGNLDVYYLAMDLSYVPTWLGPAHVKWMPELRGQLAPLLDPHFQGEVVFWQFYIPFVRNLLDTVAR